MLRLFWYRGRTSIEHTPVPTYSRRHLRRILSVRQYLRPAAYRLQCCLIKLELTAVWYGYGRTSGHLASPQRHTRCATIVSTSLRGSMPPPKRPPAGRRRSVALSMLDQKREPTLADILRSVNCPADETVCQVNERWSIARYVGTMVQ